MEWYRIRMLYIVMFSIWKEVARVLQLGKMRGAANKALSGKKSYWSVSDPRSFHCFLSLCALSRWVCISLKASCTFWRPIFYCLHRTLKVWGGKGFFFYLYSLQHCSTCSNGIKIHLTLRLLHWCTFHHSENLNTTKFSGGFLLL